MTEVAGNSFTDLLVNQPVLLWSLAGGVSILVIAAFLSLFLSVRSRAQKNQAQKTKAHEKTISDSEKLASVISELQTITVEEDEPGEKRRGASHPPVETVALGGDGGENAEVANFVQTAVADGDAATAVAQETSLEESAEGEVNEFAAMFEADVIVDPYVQALRDNLPEVNIESLLENVRSISTQLQEHIDAAQAATRS